MNRVTLRLASRTTPSSLTPHRPAATFIHRSDTVTVREQRSYTYTVPCIRPTILHNDNVLDTTPTPAMRHARPRHRTTDSHPPSIHCAAQPTTPVHQLSLTCAPTSRRVNERACHPAITTRTPASAAPPPSSRARLPRVHLPSPHCPWGSLSATQRRSWSTSAGPRWTARPPSWTLR